MTLTTNRFNMKRALILLVFPLTFLAIVQLGRPQPTVTQMQETYDTVKAAHWFTLGGVGIAGSLSAEERAFRELLRQPDSVARCQRLLAEATPAGQMYGLLGLWLLDRPAFQATLPRYKDATTSILTAHGCLLMNDTSANFARQIESGMLR